MSFRTPSIGQSSDIFGAINVDESEEYQNDDDESADDTPEPKQPPRKNLPSRPPTSSASFRLPTTRPTTAQQPAASASFTLRNRGTPGGGSPRSPESPPSTLSRFASFFRAPSFHATNASSSSHSITSSSSSSPSSAPPASVPDGMEVIKLDRRGGMSRKRLFLHVDDQHNTAAVTWDSDRIKREKATMALSECRLECGYHQGWFQTIKGKERARLVNSHCFSLINDKRSLDVICKSTADANAWIAAVTPYLPPVAALPPCAGRLMRVCESHVRGGAVSLPSGVAVSPITGQLFVVNSGCDNVLVFDRQGECVAVWGRRGSDDTCFLQPTGVGMGWDEAVCYVCDTGNNRVQVMDVRGSLRESWADNDRNSQPVAITISPFTHRLYIADNALRCIQVCTPTGDHLAIIQVAERDCLRTGGIAVTGSGERDDQLWVANSQHHRLECYDVASGVWVRSIGSKGAKLGQLFTPRGLAFDVVHRLLYVADSDNHRVVVWDVEGGEWVLEWGREGPEVCEFVKPHGVAVCPLTGLVTVTDTRNNRVQTFY